MPTKVLPVQSGNSCAAHCTVIAVAELLDVQYLLSKSYAEDILWPSIKFKGNEGPVSVELAKKDNSDPRLIVSESDLRWGGALTATLLCDETEKATALTFVPTPVGMALGGLFIMIKGASGATTITPEDGIYYNCSYLMLAGGKARSATYEGMHNILVTKSGGAFHYYNSNEKTPKWGQCPSDWKTLENQNAGTYSYVFTGVCVAMKRK